ncbi:GIP [Symbiodinium sp. CCMP2456]|nr:GIP [Symbiodinium sp. CCMP2456]
MTEYPFDAKAERKFLMRHVFNRTLASQQMSRRLQRQAELKEARDQCPDTWEQTWVPEPEIPVTGMREVEVPAELREWHYGVQRDIDAKQSSYAEGRSRPAPAVAASSSSLNPPMVTASLDEVIDAIPYRTEASRTFSAAKAARKSEATTEAPSSSTAPPSGGRNLQVNPRDLIGYKVGDDDDLNYMLGADDNHYCRLSSDNPEHDDMRVIKKGDIPMDYLQKPPRWVDRVSKWMIGAVRGSVVESRSRVGKWIRVEELLFLLKRRHNVEIGHRMLQSVVAHDNKGRFLLAGHAKDPRNDYIDCGVWPLWISASHGHSARIQDEVDDSSIATRWLDPRRRAIDRVPAAYKGKPFLCRDDEGFPARLYHRTTHDAAFQILEDGLIPGFRGSGKYHCYFAKATLSELGSRAGVRANLHVELVFDTLEVLKHSYLFETESEGILCRERVPGECVLYVRDFDSNMTLWTRPSPGDEDIEVIVEIAGITTIEDDDEPADLFSFPEPAEPEEEAAILSESIQEPEAEATTLDEEVPAPLSGGHGDDDAPPVSGTSDTPMPAILDATAADVLPEETALLEEDDGTTNRPADITEADTTMAMIDDEPEVAAAAEAPVAPKEEHVTRPAINMPTEPPHRILPPPAPSSGGRRRACPHCGTSHLVGQMVCPRCKAQLAKATAQSQRKRIKTDRFRWFQEQAAALATGKARSRLTVEEVLANIRREVGGRGAQSLDSVAIEKAKQMLKLANKQGCASIVERFDTDAEYTLASLNNGYDRDFLRTQDVLVHGILPNLGRNQAQRTLGTGVHGSGSWDRPESPESVARLLYLHDCNPAALRAGLLGTEQDDPLAIMWLGVAYSISGFIQVFLQHRAIDRLQCFTETLYLDPSLDYTAAEWDLWLRQRRNTQLQPAIRAHEERLADAECSRAAQRAADERRATKGESKGGKKGSTKGPHPYARGGYGYHR